MSIGNILSLQYNYELILVLLLHRTELSINTQDTDCPLKQPWSI